ncbi:hypothetical protein TIFTF001_046216 [Ficus carica]|uniref:Uncharacterized protein n=1 Tax=Ficus carica TaxID=3494 RepID=A0AA88D657_FICCA|nr:hypothetical protein TIFTF001_046216 [Ficus carica]
MNEFSSASEHEEDDQSSENELSNDDGFLAMAVVTVAASRHNRRRDSQPMHNSRLTGSMRMEEIINEHEEIIQDLINCTSHLFIRYEIYKMLASYEGSCHDARMLEEAIAFHGFPIPPPSGHVDVNADVELPDGADDAGLSIGSQQDALTSGAMNQRREVLADEMWDIYQQFPWYKST